jgi:hypothetical protein
MIAVEVAMVRCTATTPVSGESFRRGCALSGYLLSQECL